jgi:hypothetical protein
MSNIIYWVISNEYYKRLNTYDVYNTYTDAQNKLRSWYGIGATSKHYNEIPTWIPLADSIFTRANPSLKREVRIVTNITNQPIKCDSDTIHVFSVMNGTVDVILSVINSLPADSIIYLGGYGKSCDELLSKLPANRHDIQYFNSIVDLSISKLGIDEYPIPNYELFKDMYTIPRITLSRGCKNNCSFCVANKQPFKELSYDDVYAQIQALQPLQFKYIYIDDKTFGQASNINWLKGLKSAIEQFNPDFVGYIVQTDAIMLSDLKFCEKLKSYDVKFVELGVESYNNDVLQYMNKRITTDLIALSMKYCDRLGIKVIPNIIIGLPTENLYSYLNTIDFVRRYKNKGKKGIDIINIFLYADYANNQSELDYNRVLSIRDNQIFLLSLLSLLQDKYNSLFNIDNNNNTIS